jgi:hypothetical protein
MYIFDGAIVKPIINQVSEPGNMASVESGGFGELARTDPVKMLISKAYSIRK